MGMLIMEACCYVILQKTMSPRKSEEGAMIKFCKS